MTTQELAELVGRMRAKQRVYFRTRAEQALHESKALERQVDAAVAEATGTAAPGLFDGTYADAGDGQRKGAGKVPGAPDGQ